ncbi:hypothetical protein CS8_089580 [Cupriavidus sp. 8B]
MVRAAATQAGDTDRAWVTQSTMASGEQLPRQAQPITRAAAEGVGAQIARMRRQRKGQQLFCRARKGVL